VAELQLRFQILLGECGAQLAQPVPAVLGEDAWHAGKWFAGPQIECLGQHLLGAVRITGRYQHLADIAALDPAA
jgi:hypothetical protein